MSGPLRFRRRAVAAVWVPAVVLVGLAVPASSAIASDGNRCFVSYPTERPHWTLSGTWDGDDLLLVDAASNSILRYSPEGRALGPLASPSSQGLSPFQPSEIARHDSSLVIKLTSGRMVFLGPDHSIRSRREIYRESAGSTGRIDAIRQWTLAGDDLVLCGDIKLSAKDPGGKARWKSAFVRVPLSGPANFEELWAFDGLDDPAEPFCRLGYPYIASIGETAYFLVMDQAPTIYRATPGAEPKPLAEAELPPRPKLPGLVRPEDFVTAFRMLENVAMPAGLLAWEKRLFLMMREPTIAATRWTLHEIDPIDGSEIAQAEIPSRANYLLAVPGESQWVFVEKGPVIALGEQHVERFLHVSADRIRTIGSAESLCPSALSSAVP